MPAALHGAPKPPDYESLSAEVRQRKNVLRETFSLAAEMHQKHSKSAKLVCRIDVTAFAGVMFALVAMFLLPASVVTEFRGPSADLAKVSHPVAMRAALREDALLVAVERDGKVFFGNDVVPAEGLAALIKERLSHGAERKVYIRADARAKYGAVAEVLDRVRSAGVENIAFLVDERKSPSVYQ